LLDLDRLIEAFRNRGDSAELFHRARFDAGLAWVHFPEGAGGLGLGPEDQAVVEKRILDAGLPLPDVEKNPLGHGMVAPTIARHGTPAQRVRFLRPCFANEEIWCQLFSEPGAGSDLASLTTRAELDGDNWVVSGQKVWTTLAHQARWAILLARTDPEKHRGLTYFVLDMRADGVDVRPLRQITGEAEFNEVFLAEVSIPDSHRIGEVGQGWMVAMTTLANERVAIGDHSAGRGEGPIAQAVDLWRSSQRRPGDRDRLMRLWVETEVTRLTNMRARHMQATATPGPQGSVAKLAFAEINQRTFEFCVDVLGPDGALYPAGFALRQPDRAALVNGDPRVLFLRSRANSIEGGTSEILRNVLGERVLRLPR
jgi:alkylation response protein AidB-like acyl-CoA dehydrogenase